MSEQNASVAQSYAIAEHFSERARRVAAAAEYVIVPNLLKDKFGMRLRRTLRDTIPYCPLGVLLIEDDMVPGELRFYSEPIPDDVASLILMKRTGRKLDVIYSNDDRYAEWRKIKEQANTFTTAWDRFNLSVDDLDVALGLVPPSWDETQNG